MSAKSKTNPISSIPPIPIDTPSFPFAGFRIKQLRLSLFMDINHFASLSNVPTEFIEQIESGDFSDSHNYFLNVLLTLSQKLKVNLNLLLFGFNLNSFSQSNSDIRKTQQLNEFPLLLQIPQIEQAIFNKLEILKRSHKDIINAFYNSAGNMAIKENSHG